MRQNFFTVYSACVDVLKSSRRTGLTGVKKDDSKKLWAYSHLKKKTSQGSVRLTQGATKRCCRSLLTKSALVSMSSNAGGGGVAGSQPMSTAVYNAKRAQISCGDLTPYLTYGLTIRK